MSYFQSTKQNNSPGRRYSCPQFSLSTYGQKSDYCFMIVSGTNHVTLEITRKQAATYLWNYRKEQRNHEKWLAEYRSEIEHSDAGFHPDPMDENDDDTSRENDPEVLTIGNDGILEYEKISELLKPVS